MSSRYHGYHIPAGNLMVSEGSYADAIQRLPSTRKLPKYSGNTRGIYGSHLNVEYCIGIWMDVCVFSYIACCHTHKNPLYTPDKYEYFI